VIVKEEVVEWKPHSIVEGVKIKPLLTKEKHGADVTCMLVIVRKGLEVPEHIHEEQDDILYPLSGKAKMWIDGIGEFELTKGMLVRVQKKTKHKIYDITEDLMIYNVFTPATI